MCTRDQGWGPQVAPGLGASKPGAKTHALRLRPARSSVAALTNGIAGSDSVPANLEAALRLISELGGFFTLWPHAHSCTQANDATGGRVVQGWIVRCWFWLHPPNISQCGVERSLDRFVRFGIGQALASCRSSRAQSIAQSIAQVVGWSSERRSAAAALDVRCPVTHRLSAAGGAAHPRAVESTASGRLARPVVADLAHGVVTGAT